MPQRFRVFTRHEQGAHAFALFLLACATLALAWPWISGNVSVPWDAKAHFLPQLQFLAACLGSGESPFWSPNIFSGHAQIADPQSMIFSPPYALLALAGRFPGPWAQDVTLYAFLFLSMLAMLAWLTDRGWHPAATIVSVLGFAFGAAMAWRVQHVGQVLSLGYLPMALLCLDRALERRSLVWGALAGAVLACLILGRDQVALLALFFLAAYVPSRLWEQAGANGDRKSAIVPAVIPVVVAGVISSLLVIIPITLTMLAAAGSNRPSIDFIGAGRGSLHPASLLTVFSADVFGASGHQGEYWGPPSARWSGLDLFLAQNMSVVYTGALSIMLVVFGTVSGILWRRDARIFAAALILTCIYAVGWYTPIFKLMHAYVPGVALYRRPADAVFNIGFYLSFLAGFTLNVVLREGMPQLSRLRTLLLAGVPLAAIAAMLVLARHFDAMHLAGSTITASAFTLAIATALIFALPKIAARSAMAASLVAAVFMTADLAWSNGPNGSTALPPETFDVLRPDSGNQTITLLKELTARGQSSTRRDRVELVGFGFHWPNASLTHGLENTLGYNPVRSALYVAATGAQDHTGLPEQKSFSKLYPSYNSRLADLLGLRYIAISVPVETIDKTLRPGDLTLVAKTSDGYVYENPRALPRVMFAANALAADFDAIVASGQWPEFDPQSTVLIGKTHGATGSVRAGSATIDAYHNTRVSLSVDSPDGGYVVLNDMWHPWWFASLDGTEAPIERANVLFRAVAVPAGKHSIEMRFRPLAGAWRQLTSHGAAASAAAN